jgi:hypothetical protein
MTPARESPSVFLRCAIGRCAIGRFAGVVGTKSNSSSEGTSNTSELVAVARAFAGVCATFPSVLGPASDTVEVTACLCGRSGEGASSWRRLGRGGGRRESLPYVTLLRLSPVVNVDAVCDAMVGAWKWCFVPEDVLCRSAHRDARDWTGDRDQDHVSIGSLQSSLRIQRGEGDCDRHSQ